MNSSNRTNLLSKMSYKEYIAFVHYYFLKAFFFLKSSFKTAQLDSLQTRTGYDIRALFFMTSKTLSFVHCLELTAIISKKSIYCSFNSRFWYSIKFKLTLTYGAYNISSRSFYNIYKLSPCYTHPRYS